MPQRIPDEARLPELTLRGIILGAIITLLFTASNVYLGLKVGLTFASAIPAAVISMAVLRRVAGANKLENNMVQTQASAAGTLSAIIFVLPGLLMIGYWQGFPFWQTTAICAIGGILGVLYTIPLRRVMVVQSDLPYPEGIAAAEILEVGSRDSRHRKVERSAEDGDHHDVADDEGPGAREILLGGIVAAVFSIASGGLRILADSVSVWFSAGRAAFQLSTGFSLALVGAGYLVGIVGGVAILIGTLIAWGVAVPWLTSVTPPEAGQSLADAGMALWSDKVRFIGAGTIGIAAVWTLATLFKPMVIGIRTSFGAMRGDHGAFSEQPRTERDLPAAIIMSLTGVLLLLLTAVFAIFLHDAAPELAGGAFWTLTLGSVLFAGMFGFLIAAACGYMAGLVGSSSSPISGIGIVAVILVSLLLLGFTAVSDAFDALDPEVARMLPTALALFVTSVILAVAAISNDNLQDLKTGYLVGATPWRQQAALIIGCLVGAAVIPPVLSLLYNAYGFVGAMPREGMDPSQALAAPQASLMTAIVRGVFSHDLEWTMILIGLAIGVVLIAVDEFLRKRGGIARLPVLAVGIGIYLPPSVNMPLVIGAVLAWAIDRRLRARALARGEDIEHASTRPRQRGVLLASGMIVGESLVGVLMAGIIGLSGAPAPLALVGDGFADTARWLGLIVFVAVCFGFYRRVLAKPSVA
ncbi:oligopeptide transporter, OPT family [Salinicola sp. MIT1003]|uniref:OPT family oligopeptide transporter n=1 Tax=Salinicola sp. MIT1003 TaxID=1882734 RepID=UPI0008DD4D12|nr:oligopeptide transporter, OPT family [Salinicola sp. MIT1003]OHZ03196.1 oligopeptide transporter, OPT family [Salinicola sp. MIT1003]